MEASQADPTRQRRARCHPQLRTFSTTPSVLVLTLNQLEWVVSLPWPGSSIAVASTSLDVLRDRAFLKKAKEQLDSDHFGLEKIKKRLIEYLAIVRLKALQSEIDAKHDAEIQQAQLAVVPKDEAKNNNPTVDGKPSPPPPQPLTPRRKPTKGPILLYVIYSYTISYTNARAGSWAHRGRGKPLWDSR